jgi:hypothetical protein
MGRIRAALKRLERTADSETIKLACPECGKQWRVRGDADLEVLAHYWQQEYKGETYRDTPADVLALVEHEHDVEALIDRRTNRSWLQDLIKAPHGNTMLTAEAWDER